MTEQAGEPVAEVETDHEEERREFAFGWMYLAFLFVVFLVLALLAYSCDDDAADSALTETAVTIAPESDSGAAETGDLSPIALDATVEGGRVTLSGAVPDEAARSQMLQIAEGRYGAGNVIDQLTIDSGTTIKGGTITVHGETNTGDDLPAQLAADFEAAAGLSSDVSGVVYNDIVLTPFAATADITTDKVALTGVLPDQASIDALVAAASDTWGAENVDASGVTIGENLTAEGSSLTVTGTVDAGDTRVTDFETAAAAALPGSSIDSAGVSIDTSAEALARTEAALTEALAAEPILFASGSAVIDPVSDDILERVAAAINAAPGIAVEVVGHTDSQGSAAVNTELSRLRAEAVVERLVELDVDADRLTSRGAGEDEPIASNDTEEGRAANRRIAFEFAGAEE